jgi:hypothetical protein
MVMGMINNIKKTICKIMPHVNELPLSFHNRILCTTMNSSLWIMGELYFDINSLSSYHNELFENMVIVSGITLTRWNGLGSISKV